MIFRCCHGRWILVLMWWLIHTLLCKVPAGNGAKNEGSNRYRKGYDNPLLHWNETHGPRCSFPRMEIQLRPFPCHDCTRIIQKTRTPSAELVFGHCSYTETILYAINCARFERILPGKQWWEFFVYFPHQIYHRAIFSLRLSKVTTEKWKNHERGRPRKQVDKDLGDR